MMIARYVALLTVLLPVIAIQGCTSPGTIELVETDAHIAARPENTDAAKMTDEFLLILARKLPIAERASQMYMRDQYVRNVFISMFSDPELAPEVRSQFQEAGGRYVTEIDRRNTEELKAILADHSWEDIVSQEPHLFSYLFFIVQHSPDLEFRAEAAAQLAPLAETGKIPAETYAMLADKVTLAQGRGQVYGTQYKCAGSEYTAYELVDAETVDQRRASVGLEPLADYLARASELYGPCS